MEILFSHQTFCAAIKAKNIKILFDILDYVFFKNKFENGISQKQTYRKTFRWVNHKII